MHYYSLLKKAPNTSFKQATIQGQAPDKGLYFPSNIPFYSTQEMNGLKNLSKADLGFKIMLPYIGNEIPETDLFNIVSETIDFDIPIKKISTDISVLELFHGPTLAFKDVGARFMSRCLGYFSKNNHFTTTVLVATSGDTGGAVANGFLGVEGVQVIILYPKNKVSKIQELQLTTCGKNITALEVEGSFDDCQAMVKEAFMDMDLTKKYTLTSANSINVARWLPQQLYYFLAWQQWDEFEIPVISVPSGNFGNICAGILAQKSGLPITHFIAACNANNIITDYLTTTQYTSRLSIPTISNAMDVANPSNFVRIEAIFENIFKEVQSNITSYSISDELTKKGIENLFKAYNYIADPHGAVAYQALLQYQQKNKVKGLFLETAHPIKFPEVVEETIQQKLEVPKSVSYLLSKQKQSQLLKPTFLALKEWMMENK